MLNTRLGGFFVPHIQRSLHYIHRLKNGLDAFVSWETGGKSDSKRRKDFVPDAPPHSVMI